MKHKHRIKQGYKGGEYTTDNVVELSPTCHAMWHWCEWQREGNRKDYQAWKGLANGGGQPPTKPCVYKGVEYPSIAAAAQAADRTPGTVSVWCKNRREGVPEGKGSGKKYKTPVVWEGKSFPSLTEAAEYFGVSKGCLQLRIKRLKKSAATSRQ